MRQRLKMGCGQKTQEPCQTDSPIRFFVACEGTFRWIVCDLLVRVNEFHKNVRIEIVLVQKPIQVHTIRPQNMPHLRDPALDFDLYHSFIILRERQSWKIINDSCIV